MAGLALGDIDVHSAWHAWHLEGPGMVLVARLGPVVAAVVCVAGVTLGDIDLYFAWQVLCIDSIRLKHLSYSQFPGCP